MNLAVIPARGGSKRIPRKNVRPFAGKPVIAWSIRAAIESRCFDRVIVSTDDSEIAEIASHFGAEVPFRRPEALSNDHASTADVMRHAIDWIGQQGPMPSHCCCIYATAPLMRVVDVAEGFRLLQANDADYVVPVTTFAFPIQRACRVEGKRLHMIQPDRAMQRSQDLEECYHDAGQFYWGTSEAWQECKPLFKGRAVPLLLDRNHVQDIDTEEDWRRAEMIFRLMRSQPDLKAQ